MVFTDRRVGVMYGTESVYGTAVAATTAIGKVTNFTVNESQGVIPLRGLGEGRNVNQWNYGNYDVSGTLSWEVHDFTFLQYGIGPLSGGGVNDGDPKILTEAGEYGTGGSDINSFTMVVNDEDSSADQEDTYTGCILGEVTLQGSEGGRVIASAVWTGQKSSKDTAIANAYTKVTINPYLVSQTSSIKWGASPSALAKIVSWSVTIKNNPNIFRKGVGETDQRFIDQPVAGFRDYLFTVTLRESQAILATLESNFLNDGSEPYTPTDAVASASPTASLELEIIFGEGVGAGDRKATIGLDEATLFEQNRTVNLGGGIVQKTYNGGAKEGKSNIPFTWVD